MTTIAPSIYYPTVGWPCWPTWNERLVAASLGDVVASAIRSYETERENGVKTADAFALARIVEATTDGKLSESDSWRLRALLEPADQQAAPTASDLFDQAFDDPDSTPLALGVLSLLKLHEDLTTMEDDVSYSTGEVVAIALVSAALPPFGVGFAIGTGAAYVARHLHWE